MFESFFKILTDVTGISSNVSESWSSLSFSGTLKSDVDKNLIEQLKNECVSSLILKTLSYRIDNTPIGTFEEFSEDLIVGSNWTVSINKIINIEQTSMNFFYSKKEFKKWSDSLDPFSEENPLLKFNGLRIVVNNFKNKIVGANFLITDEIDSSLFSISQSKLPDFDNIKKNVHILAQQNFVISPQNFLILKGECTDDTYSFFKLCAANLAATLCSEIIDSENIVLRGIRKIDLILFKNTTPLNIDFIKDLSNTIEWIYEDRTDLKIKLYLDRITLDINFKNDYVHELSLINNISLLQAKERYSFAIFERKDQYYKELRDLLKDLKTISDLYSTKARTVLSNLLRDVLAGFILIGITLLSKIENPEKVIENQTIKYVFQAFSIYFIISILYQSLFDFIDISKTTKEFKYWKKTSREYISEEEFKAHLNATIDKRELFTCLFYIVLITTYFFIAYCSWNFIDFLSTIVTTK